ncbi:MAG: hypothetical protein CFE23_16000 [Flavobacterium sp. BFFFF1]|nr:MAG: hypothetical protein CFE23_16000 [Flavobacterium sp. BFFFF1]
MKKPTKLTILFFSKVILLVVFLSGIYIINYKIIDSYNIEIDANLKTTISADKLTDFEILKLKSIAFQKKSDFSNYSDYIFLMCAVAITLFNFLNSKTNIENKPLQEIESKD